LERSILSIRRRLQADVAPATGYCLMGAPAIRAEMKALGICPLPCARTIDRVPERNGGRGGRSLLKGCRDRYSNRVGVRVNLTIHTLAIEHFKVEPACRFGAAKRNRPENSGRSRQALTDEIQNRPAILDSVDYVI